MNEKSSYHSKSTPPDQGGTVKPVRLAPRLLATLVLSFLLMFDEVLTQPPSTTSCPDTTCALCNQATTSNCWACKTNYILDALAMTCIYNNTILYQSQSYQLMGLVAQNDMVALADGGITPQGSYQAKPCQASNCGNCSANYKQCISCQSYYLMYNGNCYYQYDWSSFPAGTGLAYDVGYEVLASFQNPPNGAVATGLSTCKQSICLSCKQNSSSCEQCPTGYVTALGSPYGICYSLSNSDTWPTAFGMSSFGMPSITRCPPGCLSCKTDSSKCSSCQLGFFPYNNSCTKDLTYTSPPCSVVGCVTCSANDPTVCTLCDASNQMILNAFDKKCYSNLTSPNYELPIGMGKVVGAPAGSFFWCTDLNCASCTADNAVCTQCMPFFVLNSSNQCVRNSSWNCADINCEICSPTNASSCSKCSTTPRYGPLPLLLNTTSCYLPPNLPAHVGPYTSLQLQPGSNPANYTLKRISQYEQTFAYCSYSACNNCSLSYLFCLDNAPAKVFDPVASAWINASTPLSLSPGVGLFYLSKPSSNSTAFNGSGPNVPNPLIPTASICLDSNCLKCYSNAAFCTQCKAGYSFSYNGTCTTTPTACTIPNCAQCTVPFNPLNYSNCLACSSGFINVSVLLDPTFGSLNNLRYAGVCATYSLSNPNSVTLQTSPLDSYGSGSNSFNIPPGIGVDGFSIGQANYSLAYCADQFCNNCIANTSACTNCTVGFTLNGQGKCVSAATCNDPNCIVCSNPAICTKCGQSMFPALAAYSLSPYYSNYGLRLDTFTCITPAQARQQQLQLQATLNGTLYNQGMYQPPNPDIASALNVTLLPCLDPNCEDCTPTGPYWTFNYTVKCNKCKAGYVPEQFPNFLQFPRCISLTVPINGNQTTGPITQNSLSLNQFIDYNNHLQQPQYSGCYDPTCMDCKESHMHCADCGAYFGIVTNFSIPGYCNAASNTSRCFVENCVSCPVSFSECGICASGYVLDPATARCTQIDLSRNWPFGTGVSPASVIVPCSDPLCAVCTTSSSVCTTCVAGASLQASGVCKSSAQCTDPTCLACPNSPSVCTQCAPQPSNMNYPRVMDPTGKCYDSRPSQWPASFGVSSTGAATIIKYIGSQGVSVQAPLAIAPCTDGNCLNCTADNSVCTVCKAAFFLHLSGCIPATIPSTTPSYGPADLSWFEGNTRCYTFYDSWDVPKPGFLVWEDAQSYLQIGHLQRWYWEVSPQAQGSFMQQQANGMNAFFSAVSGSTIRVTVVQRNPNLFDRSSPQARTYDSVYTMTGTANALIKCVDTKCTNCGYSAFRCEQCTAGYVLSSLGNCYPPMTCTDSNCASCLNGNSNTCYDCKPGYLLNDITRTCVANSSVPVGNGRLFGASIVRPCLVANCQSCASDNLRCDVCAAGYIPVDNMMYCINNTVNLAAYPLGYSNTTPGVRLSACNDIYCANCTQNSSVCTNCFKPTVRYVVNGSCLANHSAYWPLNTSYINSSAVGPSTCADAGCIMCFASSATCEMCRAGYLIAGGKCFDASGAGSVPGVGCSDPSCGDCSGAPNFCSRCITGFFLLPQDGTCIGSDPTQWPSGFGLNKSASNSWTLSPCNNSLCTNCVNDVNVCTACSEGSTLTNTICTLSPTGGAAPPPPKVEVDDVCPQEFFCKKCDSSSKSKCMSCNTGFKMSDDSKSCQSEHKSDYKPGSTSATVSVEGDRQIDQSTTYFYIYDPATKKTVTCSQCKIIRIDVSDGAKQLKFAVVYSDATINNGLLYIVPYVKATGRRRLQTSLVSTTPIVVTGISTTKAEGESNVTFWVFVGFNLFRLVLSVCSNNQFATRTLSHVQYVLLFPLLSAPHQFLAFQTINFGSFKMWFTTSSATSGSPLVDYLSLSLVFTVFSLAAATVMWFCRNKAWTNRFRLKQLFNFHHAISYTNGMCLATLLCIFGSPFAASPLNAVVASVFSLFYLGYFCALTLASYFMCVSAASFEQSINVAEALPSKPYLHFVATSFDNLKASSTKLTLFLPSIRMLACLLIALIVTNVSANTSVYVCIALEFLAIIAQLVLMFAKKLQCYQSKLKAGLELATDVLILAYLVLVCSENRYNEKTSPSFPIFASPMLASLCILLFLCFAGIILGIVSGEGEPQKDQQKVQPVSLIRRAEEGKGLGSGGESEVMKSSLRE